MATQFYTHTNNGRAKLTAPHIVGDNKLTVDNPAAFGNPPFHVTAVNSYGIAIFLITSKTGNDLIIGGFLGGTVDIPLLINTYVEDRPIAEDLSIAYTAINNLENNQNYIYTQGVPSATWNIIHNLNKMPSVTVVDSADNMVIGDIRYIDLNNVQLNFNGGFSGKAYLN